LAYDVDVMFTAGLSVAVMVAAAVETPVTPTAGLSETVTVNGGTRGVRPAKLDNVNVPDAITAAAARTDPLRVRLPLDAKPCARAAAVPDSVSAPATIAAACAATVPVRVRLPEPPPASNALPVPVRVIAPVAVTGELT